MISEEHAVVPLRRLMEQNRSLVLVALSKQWILIEVQVKIREGHETIENWMALEGFAYFSG